MDIGFQQTIRANDRAHPVGLATPGRPGADHVANRAWADRGYSVPKTSGCCGLRDRADASRHVLHRGRGDVDQALHDHDIALDPFGNPPT